MFLSVFDIFKIGIGPSSSHTMGPMVAAARFLDDLRGGVEQIPGSGELHALKARLHGSLAFTGKGHATDRAVILGLAGCRPETLDPDAAEGIEAGVREAREIRAEGLPPLAFDPETDLVFDYGPGLPGHANGMVLEAFDRHGNPWHRQVYYSVGGGFVLTEAELAAQHAGPQDLHDEKVAHAFPYPFGSAAEMLEMGRTSGKTIAEMKRANEAVMLGQGLDAAVDRIWDAMNACIERGLTQEGILPGGLKVRRRAKGIHEKLQGERGLNLAQPHQANDWMSVYAMAVNEENAAGGKVVTAPTNGAAGVVPAVGRYYLDHCVGASRDGLRDYIIVAAAVGGLIKHNASISGAEVGCQGEVGSARRRQPRQCTGQPAAGDEIAVHQQELPARRQHAVPLGEGRRRIDQRPDQVPRHDHVHAAIGQHRPFGIGLQERNAGKLRAGPRQHRLGPVEPGHLEAQLPAEPRDLAGSRGEVEKPPPRGRSQMPPEQRLPGGHLGALRDPVAGITVEACGPVGPVVADLVAEIAVGKAWRGHRHPPEVACACHPFFDYFCQL